MIIINKNTKLKEDVPMGEYWTIDGMLEATGKKKKDKKGKDKDKKQTE